MNKPKMSPKDFFLWAGAVIALYVSVFNYIALVWDYINYAYPDPLQYYNPDPYQGGISWEMASLIVLTPAFLVLMYLIRRDIARDSERRDIWVRRWALYLTVFLAGAMILGDLIYVLYAFLNGSDLTVRFFLKALVVLFVAAIGLMHFLADVWNYWQLYPMRNRYVGVATLVLVIITVTSGFFIVGSPAQARIRRFDDQKISDLTNIQSQVVNYWQQKEKLPAGLNDLTDPLSGMIVPRDPQSGESYVYEVTADKSFKLCATFNAAGQSNNYQAAARPAPAAPAPVGPTGATQEKGSLEDVTWQHGTGQMCFERTIDPQKYPPYSKMKNI